MFQSQLCFVSALAHILITNDVPKFSLDIYHDTICWYEYCRLRLLGLGYGRCLKMRKGMLEIVKVSFEVILTTRDTTANDINTITTNVGDS